jgi:homoserine dehydrogenase
MTIGIGLLGCGTVGANVADRLQRERHEIQRRSGVRYELRAIAIRDPHKERPGSLDRQLFTRNARSVVDDPHVDLVVELIGGMDDAASLVERALQRGRHVVTANKDLLGTQGPRLRALAASRGAVLRFEAAVGGAIPILRTLGEALAGDDVVGVTGVLNGTCTSILSAMERGAEFGAALATAQRLGYAESDPANDIDGTDAAHKLAIIAQVAFGLAVISPRIRRSGITAVTQRDVARAQMLGFRIRLVAAAHKSDSGMLAEVAPVLIPRDHEFARTADAENAIAVVARDAERIVLRGPGAGGPATASAVLGDVVHVLRGASRHRDASLAPALEIRPWFERLERIPELSAYPIWDDAAAENRERALAHA